ncbi:MAG TPA: hypothetical protein VII75_15625 [Thermoanaerobaculia bacterium]
MKFAQQFLKMLHPIVTAIERIHFWDYLLGLSSHPTALVAIGHAIGTPYGALILLVIATVVGPIIIKELEKRLRPRRRRVTKAPKPLNPRKGQKALDDPRKKTRSTAKRPRQPRKKEK